MSNVQQINSCDDLDYIFHPLNIDSIFKGFDVD